MLVELILFLLTSCEDTFFQSMYSRCLKCVFLYSKYIFLGKILAFDFGKKRTGLAVTDDLQIIASGLDTVPTVELLVYLKKYLSKETITLFVVGKPKQMNNTDSESEVLIAKFLKNLSKHFPNIPIHREDERFTSKMAFQTMIDGGLNKKQRKNKALVDKISATIILQSYLYNR
jgi:putative Holliday junction resolvase